MKNAVVLLFNAEKCANLEKRKKEIQDEIEVLKEEELSYYKEVVVLRTGKSFGELALIKNKPRAATIRTSDDCHFAVMEKENY